MTGRFLEHHRARGAMRGALAMGCAVLAFGPRVDATEDSYHLVIDPEVQYQRMEGFGASDAWNCDHIGKEWPVEDKKRVAEMLFSREFDENGQPRGIGLSIWRFNIGAGSAEQGRSSRIGSSDRRVEGFLKDDGTYDAGKQAGQRWFLEQARQYGVETTIAFLNSPPVQMTRNGIAHGSGELRANLRDDAYDDFARFMADVLQHFASKNAAFDYISPVNEPQYAWESTKQEGSPYTNEEIFRVVRELDGEIRKRGLKTRIYVPECADYRNAVGVKGRDFHSNQIEAFFDKQSPFFLGRFPSVARVFAAHSYWTTYTDEMMVGLRQSIRRKTQQVGVRFHQSEYSLIGLDRVVDDRPATDLEIGLFIGKVMHADLTIAHASSWSFWTAVGTGSARNPRFKLVAANAKDRGDRSKGGNPEWTTSLAVLGHYSRFVRPGDRRVKVDGADMVSGLLASAYRTPGGDQLKLVLTNLKKRPVAVNLKFGGISNLPQLNVYRTDADGLLKPLSGRRKLDQEIPASSMTTYVFSK